jgi:hypothetical protein
MSYGNNLHDNATATGITVSLEENKVHDGDHFFFADYKLGNGTGVVVQFVITTADDIKWPHVIFEVASGQGATIELYRDPTGVTGGTPVTPINNNGNETTVSNMTVLQDPTSITDLGTRVAGFVSGSSRRAGVIERETELILKQNTSYVFVVTSLAVSNDISWIAEWYEHANRG